MSEVDSGYRRLGGAMRMDRINDDLVQRAQRVDSMSTYEAVQPSHPSGEYASNSNMVGSFLTLQDPRASVGGDALEAVRKTYRKD